MKRIGIIFGMENTFPPALVEKIKSIAVWDTVGAMGLPRYMHGKRVDEFRFTNTRLSDKVERGFHAVALDEQRADFTPTLWDDAGNVTQMVFPGAHADVGGGYTTRNNESGLSDITLDWMVEQLKEIGVRFNQPACAQCTPDYRGTAHRPWKYPPFDLLDNAAPRRFKGIPEHPSIAQRMQAGPVRPDPKVNPEVYAPANRP